MKIKSYPFDYLFLLRPSIMVALWTFYMSGVYLSHKASGMNLFMNFTHIADILLIMLLYTLLMGSVYIFNQIADRDTDRINRKLFLIADGYISLRNANVYSLILIMISLTGIYFIPQGSMFLFILFVISLIMGILYSVPPFSFKRRPFLDLISNAIGYGFIALLIGWQSTGKGFRTEHLFLALPYVLSMSAVFINTTLMDFEGDKAVGAQTTGVFLGKRLSALISMLLMMFAALTGYDNRDWLVALVSTYSFILFLFAFIRLSPKSILSSVKYTAPVLSLGLSIIYPYFFLINLIVLISMKIYYKKRFNLDYP